MQSYSLYEMDSNESTSTYERVRPKEVRRSRRISYSRSGGRPAVLHNGVHRRRNKRWTW